MRNGYTIRDGFNMAIGCTLASVVIGGVLYGGALLVDKVKRKIDKESD